MDTITVITPTRGRTEQVKEVLLLLMSKCKHPEAVTYGIRCDDDDIETIEMLYFGTWPGTVRINVGPRGRGFLDLHKFVNEIVESYPADWYYMWDDDMYVISDGWDEIVRNESKGNLVLYDRGTSSPSVVHHSIIECIGHYARHCAIDSYIELCTKGMNITKEIPLKLKHRHMKKTWPAERKDQNRIDREAQQKEYVNDFNSKAMRAMISEDKIKIQEMLEERK